MGVRRVWQRKVAGIEPDIRREGFRMGHWLIGLIHGARDPRKERRREAIVMSEPEHSPARIRRSDGSDAACSLRKLAVGNNWNERSLPFPQAGVLDAQSRRLLWPNCSGKVFPGSTAMRQSPFFQLHHHPSTAKYILAKPDKFLFFLSLRFVG